jgi:XTP/dITP diphosphohydrolase
VLEEFWLANRQGLNYAFHKGLIQLAGAFVHLQKNRLRPSAALFKLARTNLQKYPPIHEHLNLTQVLGLIEDWLHELENNQFTFNPLTATNAPQLKLLPRMTLLIATRNAHKVEEIRAILSDRFRYLTLRDFPEAPPVVEDAATFAGNATKKAVELAQWLATRKVPKPAESSEFFVLADDSGLEVDALDGAPGVYSARFAALDTQQSGNSPDAENNAKLLRLLRNIPAGKRTARFRCVLALTPAMPAGERNASPVCAANEFELQTELFDGACEGGIALAPAGGEGFGYDPLFIPAGHGQTFAELGEEIKNGLSHRAKALAKLRKYLDALAGR